MIRHMRHGAPPRLMAPQSIGSTDLQESHPTPSAGNRLVSHGPVLSCPTSRHDACRNLYGRSRARLPTGHPSWPTCRGTGPKLVLVARVRNWSLPTGRLARSAYTGTDRALPDTGAERSLDALSS